MRTVALTDGSDQLAMICQHQTLQPGEACVLDGSHGVGFRYAKIPVFGTADVRGSLHLHLVRGFLVVQFALEMH